MSMMYKQCHARCMNSRVVFHRWPGTELRSLSLRWCLMRPVSQDGNIFTVHNGWVHCTWFCQHLPAQPTSVLSSSSQYILLQSSSGRPWWSPCPCLLPPVVGCAVKDSLAATNLWQQQFPSCQLAAIMLQAVHGLCIKFSFETLDAEHLLSALLGQPYILWSMTSAQRTCQGKSSKKPT